MPNLLENVSKSCYNHDLAQIELIEKRSQF